MTQAGPFCTLQMGNFPHLPATKLMTRTIKNPQHGIKSANGPETDKQTTNGGS